MRYFLPALLLALAVLLAGCTATGNQVNAPVSLDITKTMPANTSAPPATDKTNVPEPAGATNNTPPNSPANPPANETVSAPYYNFSSKYSDTGKLMVYFFYNPGCPSCKAVASEVERIGAKYQNRTQWHGFDINHDADHGAYQRFYREYNLTPARSGVPTILVNNTVLWGQFEIRDNLERIINGSIGGN